MLTFSSDTRILADYPPKKEFELAHRTPKRYRLSAVVALAGAAVFATSGLALADSESGQHGHYVFKDDASTKGATCVYAGSDPYKLTQIVVKPPSLWWPDTDSSNNRQHGLVGWQVSVQISVPGAYGPWHTLYTTSPQVKKAYEDQPAYDKADMAKLATWTLAINGSYKHKPHAYARIVQEAFWYNANGSMLGSVSHEQFNFKWQNVPNQNGSTTACPIHYAP